MGRKRSITLRFSFLLLASQSSLLFFFFFHLWIIFLVSEMPGNAGASCNCSELVYDVSRYEIDIVISKTNGGVFHTFSSQLV